ncbi:MAG: Uma2 family endonuclease [Chloroflexi bacterium]|nr:Uma2 family endonuclease [Chloroflexota bacterium]
MAIQTFPAVPTTDVEREPPPPLENGDHLTAAEFWERYVATPEDIHAELIEGVVFMASPIRVKRHSHPSGVIVGWLSVYEAATPLVQSSSAGTVRLDADNTVEPDAFLRIEATAGGQSRIGDDDYLDGAPELVVEIAASTVSRDLHEKKRAYRRNGVQEYIVWRTRDRALDWFRLRAGRYERIEPDADGIIHSEVFPGLWLAADKLLNGDLAGVLAELQKGLATPEHAAFVAKLARRA